MIRWAWGGAWIPFVVAALALAACARNPGPDAVALRYGRAIYASDLDSAYRLLSAQDRRVLDEATFRRQQDEHRGFTGELLGQLASFITATPVESKIAARRATVTLNFRLPDANAPEIRTPARDWDEEILNALVDAERRRVRKHLDELHRTGRLPFVEGPETMELVQDDDGWRLFLNWAGGIRLRFHPVVGDDLPLKVTITPAEIVVARGETVRVTLHAANTGPGEVTARVAHRIEPTAQARSLALLQCPLFLPARLRPGENQDFVSEYLLLKDTPDIVKGFDVTYRFAASPEDGRGASGVVGTRPAVR